MLYSRMCGDIGRRVVLAGAGSMLASPAIRAQAQTAGVALVIGNSKYKWEASLPNVKRDAPDVARQFQALGLRTVLLQDANRDTMHRAIETFAAAARGANLAAFYFAGHGASWENDTYLVPEDGDLGNPNTVQSFVSVKSISDATKAARHRLLAFDNCRNNPADGWRQRAAIISSGVARSELTAAALNGPNTLVLFSTAPGRVAIDGPAGENSPFAAAFLRQLAEPSFDLKALPTKLRRDLLIATAGRQVLWDQNTYDQPVILTNLRASAPSSVPARAPLQFVELLNAYAFAREKSLLLPPGLIALRPSTSSPDGQKVGSFKSTTKVLVGQLWAGGATAIEPLLVIVLSVSNAGTAEIIVSTRDWFTGSAKSAEGPIWRFITATLSGSRLEFKFLSAVNAFVEMPHSFSWSDANSGTYTSRPNGGNFHSSSFIRLD